MNTITSIVGTVVLVLWGASALGYGHFTFIYGPEPVQCTKGSADPPPVFFTTRS